jgi:hypothetical protein
MEKHEEKYADWDARGSRAARVIMTAVTPEICQELVGIDSAQVMWTRVVSERTMNTVHDCSFISS